MFLTGRAVCEFCKKEHKDNCDFDFEDKLHLKDIINKIRDDRDLSLVVQFKQNTNKVNLKYFDQVPEVIKLSNVPEAMQHFKYGEKGKTSLYDCLNYFTQDEMLTGDD